MQSMTTLPQDPVPEQAPLRRAVQVRLTEDAYRRIKFQSARADHPIGRVISNLATEYLPAVEADNSAV